MYVYFSGDKTDLVSMLSMYVYVQCTCGLIRLSMIEEAGIKFAHLAHKSNLLCTRARDSRDNITTHL